MITNYPVSDIYIEAYIMETRRVDMVKPIVINTSEGSYDDNKIFARKVYTHVFALFPYKDIHRI